MSSKHSNSSIILFQKYYSLGNRRIELILKNKESFTGKIVGYFYDDNFEKIIKWHVVPMNTMLGEDGFGILNGVILNHMDIETVIFDEDKTQLNMESL